MDVDRNGQLYALAERNFNKVFGSELKPCGVCAPGDAVALGRIMPVAWLGPTWDNAHGFDEKVSIKELQDMARLYLALTLDYLNA
jgi:acetylornithine deacetylase/succinyl-diaminopimelate desuccinylase-like protein